MPEDSVHQGMYKCVLPASSLLWAFSKPKTEGKVNIII